MHVYPRRGLNIRALMLDVPIKVGISIVLNIYNLEVRIVWLMSLTFTAITESHTHGSL